jgi:pyrroline-5-carboxylate reductase
MTRDPSGHARPGPGQVRDTGLVVAIVGAGNLGGAVAAGLLASGAVAPERLRCVTARPERATALAQRLRASVPDVQAGMQAGAAAPEVGIDAAAAVRGADLVLVGVKPVAVRALLTTLGPDLAKDAIVVSLAAGVPVAAVEAALPPGQRVARLMTNTPVQVRRATSMVVAGSTLGSDGLAAVVALSDALGVTHVIGESLMDVATALAGSGPAYLFLLVEALRDAGVRLGLEEGVAGAMAVQAMHGATTLLTATGQDAADLRAAVTSPGGMTASALAVFEAAGLRATALEALRAAVARAGELAGGGGSQPDEPDHPAA